MPKTKIFLLYSHEDISRFQHEDIIPLKLNQGPYLESEAFPMLSYTDLPKCDAIGFITPKSFNNLLISNNFELFMKYTLQVEIKEITSFFNFDGHTLDHGVTSHGERFRKIWNYLSEKLTYKVDYAFREVPVFFRNAWVAPRSQVVGYLYFAKEAIRIMDNAEPEIRDLLYSDPYYADGKISKADCLDIFGVPHYTYHPFIMELLICLYKYMLGGKN